MSETEDKNAQDEAADSEQVADSDAQDQPLEFTEEANDELAEALRE